MYIRNGKRFNIYASAEIDGVRYPHFTDSVIQAELGITEISEPEAPADFDYDIYYRQEQDTAPYVVYTRKSDEQIAATRWAKLKAIRDDIWHNGGCNVVVDGVPKWFHSDDHSKLQQLSLVIAGANLPNDLQWKTMDGTYVTMTPSLALQVYQAQMAAEATVFAIAEAKKLDDSPVDEGWPETYEEGASADE